MKHRPPQRIVGTSTSHESQLRQQRVAAPARTQRSTRSEQRIAVVKQRQASTGRVIEAGCWAHAHRRFFKVLDSVDKQAAAHAIAVIRRLYEIERQAKEHNLDHAARRELRQLDAKPLLESMQPWLSALQLAVLPKSSLGEAIRYTLRQWDALTRFLEDGRVAIDNNLAERQMRTVAVGRKSWMFAGSPEGGCRAAIIYWLTCTCGLLGIEPWAYLKDVLQRIAEGEDPASLTPRLWMAARGSAG